MPHDHHDHLFKVVFSRPTEATSLLSEHLPADLAAAIRWEGLVCVKSSLEDADGTSPEADLVFSVPLKSNASDGEDRDGAEAEPEIEIAILFEHQSTPDEKMPLRLLGYMLRTFEAQLTTRKRKRPVPVVPVLLYHGERPWTAPTGFADWLGLSPGALRVVRDFVPDFRHVLEQRQPPRPDAYRGNDIVRFIRLLLDHGRRDAFFADLEGWGNVVAGLNASAGDQGIVPVLAFAVSYLYRARPDAAEPLARALDRLGAEDLKEIAMNTYEQAVEQGKQIGLNEGRSIGLNEGRSIGLKEQRQLLVRLCTRRFGPLPDDALARIEIAAHETLLVWAENVVVAPTLDAVFGELIV